MNGSDDEFSFAPGVVEAVLARPIPVAVAAFVGMVLAVGATMAFLPQRYTATAVVTVADPAQTATFRDRAPTNAEYERHIAAAADFAGSAGVIEEVASQLELPARVLDNAVSTRENVARRTVSIQATADQPIDAAEWANTVLEVFEERYRDRLDAELQRSLDALDIEIAEADRIVTEARERLSADPDDAAVLTEVEDAQAQRSSLHERRTELRVNAVAYGSGIEVLEFAEVPGAPSEPNTRLNALVGLLFGTLFGVGFVWWSADRDRVFSSSEQPRGLIDTPLLGRIKQLDIDHPALTEPEAMPSHDYQFVTSALRSSLDRGLVLVGGAGSGVGTTVTTANLAVAALRDELTVAVFDLCDDQRLSELFGRDPTHSGLMDLLATPDGRLSRQRLTWSLAPVQVGDRSIRLMSLGVRDGETVANKVRSRAAQAIFAEVRDRFDMVFVDCGSVLDSPMVGALAKTADGMVLVIQHGSNSDPVIEARERLGIDQVPVTGYVYSGASDSERRHFRFAYRPDGGTPPAMNGGYGEPRTLPGRRATPELAPGKPSRRD